MIAQTTYPFALPPLPYAYDALEPYVDEATMHFHHDKHLKTYVDNLNKALEAYPQYHTWTLETLLTKLEELPDGLRTAVRNNGGGVYNHDLFFDLMAPAGQKMSPAVAEHFGGEEAWQKEMKARRWDSLVLDLRGWWLIPLGTFISLPCRTKIIRCLRG